MSNPSSFSDLELCRAMLESARDLDKANVCWTADLLREAVQRIQHLGSVPPTAELRGCHTDLDFDEN